MTETFVMIVLTLMSNGQLSAAFSNAPAKADCQASAKMVGQILTKGGYKIEKIGCYRSSQSFSPYEHGVSDDAPRQTYLVSLDGEKAEIVEHQGLAGCRPALEAMPEEQRASARCATSTQTLVK